MRGFCSIDTCSIKDEQRKMHETFEALDGINICWECGEKILAVLEKELSNG